MVLKCWTSQFVTCCMASYAAGTSFVKPKGLKRKWFLVDAKGKTLGRIASRIALVLRGKHKVDFTPHIDCGDNVVVINAANVELTGNKLSQNKFFWHTGYPGGVKSRTFDKILSSKYPERLLTNAIRGMMPKESPLSRAQFKKLYVYGSSEHPHAGQQPEILEL